jgi:hypothetical protein
MHTPDLSLASSYIPACLCLLKSLFVFICFLFSPVRGWVGIGCLLATDRVLWNRINPIMDVNAICFSLAAGLAIAHTRIDGVATNIIFHSALMGLWMLFSLIQILGFTRLGRAYEVLLAAAAVSMLSCIQQGADVPEIMALRAFMFVVSNVSLSYLGILFMDDCSDTYIHICRTIIFLLADLRIAGVWMSVYMICVGHQARSSSVFVHHAPLQQCVTVSATPAACCPAEEEPMLLKSGSSVSSMIVDDAGLLREALARKGFSRECTG